MNAQTNTALLALDFLLISQNINVRSEQEKEFRLDRFK